MSLFGREAGEGVRLLELLDRRYVVVATNPPYMGSGNMSMGLKAFVVGHYWAGRADLYSAFVLRCLGLCRINGRIAVVTQQNWMFLRSFSDLRASPTSTTDNGTRPDNFGGLLRESSLETLAHLGPNAFDEISGEVVKTALLVLLHRTPHNEHSLVALRVVGQRSAGQKSERLAQLSQRSDPDRWIITQAGLLALDGSPIAYQLGERLLGIFVREDRRLASIAEVRPGLQTSDNARFTRLIAEMPIFGFKKRWWLLSKGGGYRKWSGLRNLIVEWEHNGARVKEYNQRTGDHWSRNIRNIHYILREGLTYGSVSNAFSVRELSEAEICDTVGTGIYPTQQTAFLAVTLNTRLVNYFLKTICSDIHTNPHTLSSMPLPNIVPSWVEDLYHLLLDLKRRLVSDDMLEYSFTGSVSTLRNREPSLRASRTDCPGNDGGIYGATDHRSLRHVVARVASFFTGNGDSRGLVPTCRGI